MALTFREACPNCGSQEIYRSRYRGLEYVIRLFMVRPVRCGSCMKRHYRPAWYPVLRPVKSVRPPRRQDQRIPA